MSRTAVNTIISLKISPIEPSLEDPSLDKANENRTIDKVLLRFLAKLLQQVSVSFGVRNDEDLAR